MIKRLVIRNCLGIEELTLNPSKTNLISGGNERGKTSILETIEKCLFNTKRRARFVRTGTEKAYIELETDDGLVVKRTVKEDTAGLDMGSVKVTKDGIPVKAPESFLKQLFGITGRKTADVFAFNPVDFMLKKDTEQTAILLALMPIKVTAEDAQAWFGQAPKVNYEKHGLQVLRDLEAWFYEARHETNAKVKATKDEAEAVAKRLPDNYNLEEWNKVNLGQLFSELTDAQEVNQDIKEQTRVIETHQKDIEDINNKYDLQIAQVKEEKSKELKRIWANIQQTKDGVKRQIEETEKKLDRLKHELEMLEKTATPEEFSLDNLTIERIKHIEERRKDVLDHLARKKLTAETFLEINKPIDIAPINNRCKEAEEMKAYIPLASEVKNLNDRLKSEKNIADNYDKCVETARVKPIELLTKVKLPLKGLGIDGRGIVTINGLPLSNLSTSQQVRTCLEIARVLAKGNPLKLICVDKAEHLDESIRAEFHKQIEADQEWQYFVTEVTDGELKVEAR
ncbi:hypothetical protein D4R71_00490 [bacterium]|nr:MAG: hypothetical protein D4R71_00490 [bacterium]